MNSKSIKEMFECELIYNIEKFYTPNKVTLGWNNAILLYGDELERRFHIKWWMCSREYIDNALLEYHLLVKGQELKTDSSV